jgi:hypothetical protein
MGSWIGERNFLSGRLSNAQAGGILVCLAISKSAQGNIKYSLITKVSKALSCPERRYRGDMFSGKKSV